MTASFDVTVSSTCLPSVAEIIFSLTMSSIFNLLFECCVSKFYICYDFITVRKNIFCFFFFYKLNIYCLLCTNLFDFLKIICLVDLTTYKIVTSTIYTITYTRDRLGKSLFFTYVLNENIFFRIKLEKTSIFHYYD